MMKTAMTFALIVALAAPVAAQNCYTRDWKNGNSTMYCEDGETYDRYEGSNDNARIIKRGTNKSWRETNDTLYGGAFSWTKKNKTGSRSQLNGESALDTFRAESMGSDTDGGFGAMDGW